MATVNHAGQGMIGLPVTLHTFYGEELHGEVVKIDAEYDFLIVKWYGTVGNPMGKYACEKFDTKMVDDELTLVLSLD